MCDNRGFFYIIINHSKIFIVAHEKADDLSILGAVPDPHQNLPAKGTSCFSPCAHPGKPEGISLGDFLTGLYENRTDSSAQAPVRLADLYRSYHTDTALPQIPGITVKDRVLMVEKK